jgi:hypothetical protein
LIHARWICLTVKSTDLTPSGLGRTVDYHTAPHKIRFWLTSVFLLTRTWAWAWTPRPCYSHPPCFTTQNILHPPDLIFFSLFQKHLFGQ